jgi:hypothetical protein
MTQLQQAPRRATTLAPYIVAMVAVAVIATTIILVMLLPGRISLPGIEQGETYNQPGPALVEAERQWQYEREQQGGFTDPLTQAERAWEKQRQQQSPFGE